MPHQNKKNGQKDSQLHSGLVRHNPFKTTNKGCQHCNLMTFWIVVQWVSGYLLSPQSYKINNSN